MCYTKNLSTAEPSSSVSPGCAMCPQGLVKCGLLPLRRQWWVVLNGCVSTAQSSSTLSLGCHMKCPQGASQWQPGCPGSGLGILEEEWQVYTGPFRRGDKYWREGMVFFFFQTEGEDLLFETCFPWFPAVDIKQEVIWMFTRCGGTRPSYSTCGSLCICSNWYLHRGFNLKTWVSGSGTVSTLLHANFFT